MQKVAKNGGILVYGLRTFVQYNTPTMNKHSLSQKPCTTNLAQNYSGQNEIKVGPFARVCRKCICISRVEATSNIALHTIEFGPFISGNDKSDISAISAGLKEISVQQTQNSLNPFSFKEKDCYFLWVSKHIKHKKQLGWDSTPSLQVSELLFLTKTLIAPLFLELNFFFQKTSEFGHWALDGIK